MMGKKSIKELKPNTGIGNRTMENNTSGHSNTALGFLSLQFCLDGSYNTAFGDSANIAASSLNNTTALGAKTIVSTSNSMAFGDANVNRWVFGIPPANYTLKSVPSLVSFVFFNSIKQ